jgi:hypothetical protein
VKAWCFVIPKSDSTAGLRRLARQSVFAVGQAGYSGAAVVLAAKCWRDWAGLEQETHEGIACVLHARASQENPSEEEVEAAADAFRDARGLQAALDAEHWLAQRQLTFDAWMKYMRRCVLRTKWVSRLQELVSQYPASQKRLNRNLRVVGMCSGHFARFARKLAGRAAVHERIRQQSATGDGGQNLEGERRVVILPSSLEAKNAQLLDLSQHELAQQGQQIADLESSFGQFRVQVLAPADVQNQVSSRHLDWIRIEARTLSFHEETAAREAATCVREDAEGLEAVAARVRTPLRHECFYLEELDPDLQPAFLSACADDLIGPLPGGKEFKIDQIVKQVMPSVQDPDVRARAEQVLLEKAITFELQARVSWQVAWWSD